MSRLVVDQLQGRTSGSNTITIPTGHKINAVDAGAISAPGSVLQVTDISTTRATQSVNSSSFVAITGLSITMTPKSATSKIYIFYNVHSYHVGGGGSSIGIYKDGTLISDETSSYENYSGASDLYSRNHRTFQTTAGNTSPRTYTLGIKTYNNVASNINQGGFESTLYAMEIAQ